MRQRITTNCRFDLTARRQAQIHSGLTALFACPSYARFIRAGTSLKSEIRPTDQVVPCLLLRRLHKLCFQLFAQRHLGGVALTIAYHRRGYHTLVAL